MKHLHELQQAYRQIQDGLVVYWWLLVTLLIGLPICAIWALLSQSWFGALILGIDLLLLYQLVRSLQLLYAKRRQLFSDGAANDPA